MSKPRRLVTLPADVDERALKFCAEAGVSISAGLSMLILSALDSIDNVPMAQLCGCDQARTCAAVFKEEYTGECRRQHERPTK
jgi:hypothetical protein